jgi:hypothetical protein
MNRHQARLGARLVLVLMKQERKRVLGRDQPDVVTNVR